MARRQSKHGLGSEHVASGKSCTEAVANMHLPLYIHAGYLSSNTLLHARVISFACVILEHFSAWTFHDSKIIDGKLTKFGTFELGYSGMPNSDPP